MEVGPVQAEFARLCNYHGLSRQQTGHLQLEMTRTAGNDSISHLKNLWIAQWRDGLQATPCKTTLPHEVAGH